MFRKSASFAIAGLTMLGTISQTAAGGRAVECYEPVSTPAVYDTVYEDVMVSPPGQQVDYDPADLRHARTRGDDRSGAGDLRGRARRHPHRLPHGAGRRWRLFLGMARHPRPQGAVQDLAQGALRARRRDRGDPAGAHAAGRHPGAVRQIAEEVLVRPEQRRIIDVPASYQTVARRVVVSEGSSGWRRVHIPRHCQD